MGWPLSLRFTNSIGATPLVNDLRQSDRSSIVDGLPIPGRLPTTPYIAIFMILMLCSLRIKLVGELYALEPLLAGIVIVHALKGKRFQLHRPLGFVILLLALWFCGQVLSDIYRESAFIDYTRGWARIAFTGMNLVGLYLLIRVDATRVRVAYLGLITGQVIGFFIAPNIYAHVYPWKFGFAYPLTTLAALGACSPRIWRHRFGPILIMGPMAALNLMLGARSLAGICFVASLYAVVASRQRPLQTSASRLRAVALPLLGVIAAIIGSSIYGHLAESGALGLDAQVKYEVQSEGRYGLLLGGRREFAFSSSAILQSPIVGHGSFTKFSEGVGSVGEARLEDWGYDVTPATGGQPDLLPTHSGLLGAWVEAGLLAVPFWLICLALLWRGCLRAIQHGQALAPLAVFVALLSIWDVIFSPFASERRITLPLALLLLLAHDNNDIASRLSVDE
jgi:O-antigen ligase